VQDHLEGAGYYVDKAGGSRGAADLIALRRGQVLLVQCKVDASTDRHRGQWWNELYDLAERLDVTPVLAETPMAGRARTVVLRRLIGRHAPGSAAWPMIPFNIDGQDRM
jgi:hypothetical protein